MLNETKMVALPPTGHTPSLREKLLLARVCITTMEEGGVVVVGMPVGIEAFVRAHAEKIVKDNGADCLARLSADMADKQAATLIATK